MRPTRESLWCCALAVLALGSGTTQAAWNNVFQVCCHSCRNTSAYAAPVAVAPVAQACPQQQCTTRYEQRSYYQPVTTYTTSTYYEPVTSYRTSYYYEPVTSYRYSCYYDPCSCSYKQVATPTTSYALKSKCDPVTSYLERTALKPCTTQQLVTYYQPVTSCCQTTMGAPISTLPPGAAVAPALGPAATDQTNPPPLAPAGVAPGASDRTLPGGSDTSRKTDRFNDQAPRTMPRVNEGSSFRQPALNGPIVPVAPSNPAPPTARLDRIAMVPDFAVEGQVLSTAAQPRSGVRVLLVSKDRANVKQTVTADEKGQFHVRLESGTWLVYVQDAEGTPVYHDVLEVRGNASHPFVLTSR